MQKYLYPASFLVKKTPNGIYTSSYPLVIPEAGLIDLNHAVNKWKYWHPNTKLIFTPKKYFSYRLHDGTSYRDILKQNIVHISITDENDSDKKYRFIVCPINFKNSTSVNDTDYIEKAKGIFDEKTKYHLGKLIFFASSEQTRNYGEKVSCEFIEWWESNGQCNMEKYENYCKDGMSDPSNFEDPYRESDSWMDDQENYWNID